jgi:O-antigen/teichoic acid export membrane protein
MIFSAFSAFVGSVYFLEKRSVRSLITAAVGALTNIVLNFLLIPHFGAMGAAVATVISYLVAFIIRACDIMKYLRFELCPLKVTVNTLAIVAQTVMMLLEPPMWILWQTLFVAFMLIFNGKDIFKAVMQLAKKILGKKRKNI